MEDKTVATNRKATYQYFIMDRFEAGLELKGPEVKSIRQGKVNLQDSFARIEDGQAFLYNMHVSPYEFGTINNPDPVRPRKLLLHKREIGRLTAEVMSRRLAIVPLRVYFKHGLAKVELALAKGKRLYDKRRSIKEKETEREIRRIMRRKQ